MTTTDITHRSDHSWSHRTTARHSSALSAPLERIELDLYRDVHKGIRAELFRVTHLAGAIDPGDGSAVARVIADTTHLFHLLDQHARHEDQHLAPVLEAIEPGLATDVDTDHRAFVDQQTAILDHAFTVVGAQRPARRLAMHRLYLALASFTADYLHHQDLEEVHVMTALANALSPSEVVALNDAIVSTIEPDEMAAFLRLALPAMNIDDRADLITGMRQTAPAEAVAGVVSLAASVIGADDHAALIGRL